ncbi:tetratricopeptide (TPR) repeat protein [Lewinella marina]|nr:SH3 domain-containing protein [Neolewinella marina]NJB84832.1 tetratricopeptide (TPR) repeat protein [Neolewinella marina]
MILLLLVALSAPTAAQTDYTLRAAEAELREGDYGRAAEILDSLESTGVVSPEFYLALGNAHYESGRIGRAILAYERGLRLRPGNADLANNLRYVYSEAGIATPELPEAAIIRWWHMLGAWIGTTGAYVLALVFWWLAVAGTVWWYLRRREMEEKRRFALLPTALLLALIGGGCFLLAESRYAAIHASTEAILVTDATLRVSPSSEGSVEAELSQGHKLYITDRVNQFVKVQLPDGRQGYVSLSDLEVI